MKILKSILGETIFNLQLIFLVLKLCKLINWSWLWVISPMWILIILAIIHTMIIIYYEEIYEGGDSDGLWS